MYTVAVPYPLEQTAEIRNLADLTLNSLAELDLDEIG